MQAGSWFPPLQSKVLTPTTTRRWPAVGGQKTGPGRVARVAPLRGECLGPPLREGLGVPPEGRKQTGPKGAQQQTCDP